MTSKTSVTTRVADQVWVIAALLHREHPDREDFAIAEIVDRAKRELRIQPLRPSFHVHVIQHCVANRPPNPGRWRMLVASGPGRRRLFRSGDPYHPKREGARSNPETGALPPEYQELLSWYRREYERGGRRTKAPDPLLALRGSGRELSRDEPADAYVTRLRSGWA